MISFCMPNVWHPFTKKTHVIPKILSRSLYFNLHLTMVYIICQFKMMWTVMGWGLISIKLPCFIQKQLFGTTIHFDISFKILPNYLPGKISSIPEICRSSKSDRKYFGCQSGFHEDRILRASTIEDVFSEANIKFPMGTYPTFVGTHIAYAGREYLVVL